MITYQKATPEDTREIAPLYNGLYYFLEEVTYDPYFNTGPLSDEEKASALAEAFKDDPTFTIFIAKENNEIVGFIAGRIIPCFLGVSPIKKIGYIEAAYIREDYRRKNILTSLEEEMALHFKKEGLPFIELHILSGNTPGRRAWEKCGYTTFREQMRKKYDPKVIFLISFSILFQKYFKFHSIPIPGNSDCSIHILNNCFSNCQS